MYLAGEGLKMNYRPRGLRWLYWKHVDMDYFLKAQKMHFRKLKPYNYMIIFSLNVV